MAGKKPAKRNVTNTTVVPKAEVVGKAVLYYGISGGKFKCPTCEREFQKGMTYEHNNMQYCSRRCIKVEV